MKDKKLPLWEWSAAWRSVFFLGLPWLFSKNFTRFLISFTITIFFMPFGIYLEETNYWGEFEEYPVIYMAILFGLTGWINSDRIFKNNIEPNSKAVRSTIVGIFILGAIVGLDFMGIISVIGPNIDVETQDLSTYLWILLGIQLFGAFLSSNTYHPKLKESISDSEYVELLVRNSKKDRRIIIASFILTIIVLFYMYLDPSIQGYRGSAIKAPLYFVDIAFSFTTAQLIKYLIILFLVGLNLGSLMSYTMPVFQNGERTFEERTTRMLLFPKLIKNIYLTLVFFLASFSFLPDLAITQTIASFVNSNPSKEVFDKAQQNGLKALIDGDYDEAAEEFGYAAAAAGATGNLDDLEAMLDHLEAAQNGGN